MRRGGQVMKLVSAPVIATLALQCFGGIAEVILWWM
jgi:hypothetical protein